MTQRRFASNKMEKLLEKLNEQLLKAKPLTPKIIVVPSNRVKDWIQKQIADDPAIGVAMGMRFMGLTPAIEYLTNSALFISESALSFDIEGEIRTLLTSSEKAWAPLINYVKPEKKQVRIRHLADHLARNFLKMARYGGEFLPKWLKSSGWKQMLWKRTRIATASLKATDKICEVHFFGLSSMPELFMRFLDSCNHPIFHYIFSPCQVFWGDVLSDAARLNLLKKTKDQNLDSYLQDRNPLLANWAIKQYFKQLEKSEVEEVYEPCNEVTLLGQIQRDILDSNKKCNGKPDHSLQIHAVSSRLREIEVLKNTLIDFSVKDSLKPQDVLVLAPNIADYLPFIQKVFGDHCPFNYVIDDVAKIRNCPFLQAVQALAKLIKSRFIPSEILDFFSNPCVRKQCQISHEDLVLLDKWIRNCGIRWGWDAEHRHTLVALPGLEDEMIEKSGLGTWKFAFDGLLTGLAVIENEPCDLWPLDFVENAVSDSLGKWIKLIKKLQQNLEPMTLSAWKRRLSSLVTDLIDSNVDEKGYQIFAQAVDALSCQKDYVFPFESVWNRLEAAIESKAGILHGQDLNAVQFCSMRTGRAHPASVIWCLGQNDAAFPRMAAIDPFDELGQKGDPCPSHADEDRHLFLELLLSARHAFCLSYLSHSETDGKPQGPSILIEELLSYIGENPTTHHPSQAFDTCYFSNQQAYPCYEQHLWPLLTIDKQKLPHLIPQYFGNAPQIDPLETTIDIDVQDLAAFAKHPLAYFLKKRLNVYLEYNELDAEFHLSSLHRFLSKKNLLQEPFEQAFEKFQKSGIFPLGRFGEIAEKRLHRDAKHYAQQLANFEINPSDLFEVQMNRSDVKRFYISEKSVGLHAVECRLSDQRRIRIYGQLGHLSSKGMVVQSKSSLADQVKIWPLMLITSILDVCKPQIVFLDDGKIVEMDPDKAQEALRRYIEYYLRAQVDPSPMLPAWAGIFLKKSSQDLKISMSDDPYIRWAFSDDEAIDTKKVFDHWQEDLKMVFEDLLQ